MSTAPDMMRFANALANGTIVPEKYANQFRGIGVAGGGPGVNATLELGIAGEHSVIVLSNFDPPNASKISRQISDMLRQAADAESGVKRYRLGVGLASHDEGVEIANVEPDSPAEKGGLEPGDVPAGLGAERPNDSGGFPGQQSLVLGEQRGADDSRVGGLVDAVTEGGHGEKGKFGSSHIRESTSASV